MLHRVHGNTTHLGPAVPLHSVLVVGSASLEDWLVNPSTSSNTSNHSTVGRGDNLLRAGWELDPSPLGVRVVGDDGGVVAGGPGKLAAVDKLSSVHAFGGDEKLLLHLVAVGVPEVSPS